MSLVVFGPAGHQVEFRDPIVAKGTDPYAAGHFVATLDAKGIRAERKVFMYRHSWSELAHLFSDLAASWDDVPCERSWRSPENDLTISAAVDELGRCTLQFELRDGPWPTWRAVLTGIETAVGEDLEAIARSAASWLPR